MTSKFNYEKRILPLVLTAGEVETTFPLTWSLPGTVTEFEEPELVILKVKAKALAGEICAALEMQQDTYYKVNESGLVEKVTTVHRVTRLIQVPGVKPGNLVEVEAKADLQGNALPEQLMVRGHAATALTMDCKVKIGYSVLEEQEVALLKAENVDGIALAETLDIESVQSRFENTFDLALPLEFGSIPKAVGDLRGVLTNVKFTPMSGWVKLEGDVIVNVPYLDIMERSTGESFVFPVKHFMETPDAKAEMTVYGVGDVEVLTCRCEPGKNAGLLRGLLRVSGHLASIEPLEVAQSLRSHVTFFPNAHHGHHHHSQFLLEEVMGVGSSQTLIQREIFFPRRVRRVREPVDAQVRNLQHEIIPNKVIVRGILHKQVFAVNAETGVVFAVDVDENFVHFVDVPGAMPGMRAHVHARVEFVKIDIHPSGETARQVTIIEIRVKVTRAVKKPLIVKPAFEPVMPLGPVPHKPGRIYVVRSGDSIWRIAQMFGVTMEAIIAANNLQNPNLIFPGQQLIIPK